MNNVLENSLLKAEKKSTKEVDAILKRKLPSYSNKESFDTLWNLSDFSLENVGLIESLSLEQSHALKDKLAANRLIEAYNIEKAGMTFAAKMSLLAKSLNEQKLYSCFSKEEATHFSMIESILGDRSTDAPDEFIKFLNEVIISGSRNSLVFIIQVVLEGWGIDHYGLMAKSCKDDQMTNLFYEILADEAGHHGSGVSLFEESELSTNELNYIVEMMTHFLKMVTCGPLSTIECIKGVCHDLTKRQEQQLLQDMQAKAETIRKIDFIKGLINKSKALNIMGRLESANAFELTY